MLKYSEIITKLTDGQKIRILSEPCGVSGKDMKTLGIPCLKVGNMKDYDRSIYPHTTSVSHSWNTTLWSEIAAAKTRKMVEDGVDFVIAPGAKIKFSPYRKEPTEDPYFASVFSGAYVKAACDANINAGASGYYLTESDTEWMDKIPSKRILREYLVRPYERASELSGYKTVITDLRLSGTAYEESIPQIQQLISGSTEFLVCEKATDATTVKLISNGVICLRASSNAINTALTRYRTLNKLIEDGMTGEISQIEEEQRNGSAISDDTLNTAVDKALDFIFRCKASESRSETTDINEDDLSLRATLESTVLLKNNGSHLPISKGKRILIVDAFSDRAEGSLAEKLQATLNLLGYKKVRAVHMSRKEKLFALCRSADVTLMLLGSGHDVEASIHKTEKLTLPPHQLALADRLAENSKHPIAVVFSEHAPDIDFTRRFDGVLLTPLPVKYSTEALAQILTGAYNPSGRLAYTLYAGSETSLKKGAAYIRSHGMKVGPFIGYRYYDTAGLKVGYPFGHGLSYTEFVYSELSVVGRTVSFTVQNRGNYKGSEVAQVYVGLNGSAILRPKKELCGFAKIELEPLQKKRITLKITVPEVFCDGKFISEKGIYTVYVGASVSDIKLTGTFAAGDTQPKKNNVRLSDYLQSRSNILNDNYTLEANYGIMKKGITNIAAGTVSIALAIILAVFNSTTKASSMLLGVISGILAMSSIIFFILEMVERSRFHEEEKKKIAEANKKHFEEATQITVPSTETIFRDPRDEEIEETVEIKHHDDDKNSFIASEYIDEQFYISDAAKEFNSFAAERGYKLATGVSEMLFSSFASSRLLILNGLSGEEFSSFAMLLSEYFGSSAFIDDSSKHQYTENSNNVFFEYDSEGYSTKKNILKALENSISRPTTVNLSAIDEITAQNVGDWLAPFLKYVASTKTKNEIVIPEGNGKKLKYITGNNLWILLRLSDTTHLNTLPISVLKCASVIPISYIECQPSDDEIDAQGFTSFQVNYMLEHEINRYEVPEEIWKKVDKIESYVGRYSDYTIGNKLWLELEKQMSMLLACDLEPIDAIDAAIATRLMPSMTAALKDKLTKEDKTLLETAEFVLGADHIQFTKAYTDSLAIRIKAAEESKKNVLEEKDFSDESENLSEVSEETDISVAFDETDNNSDFDENDDEFDFDENEDIDEENNAPDFDENENSDEENDESDFDENENSDEENDESDFEENNDDFGENSDEENDESDFDENNDDFGENENSDEENDESDFDENDDNDEEIENGNGSFSFSE